MIKKSEDRRILAVFLPDILCELAREQCASSLGDSQVKAPPMGVLLEQHKGEMRPQDRLAAVCPRAFCAGARPGQTTAEAKAMLASLNVEVVEYRQVYSKLLDITEQLNVAERLNIAEQLNVAERVAQLGSSPSWNITEQVDTLWLDISGVGPLHISERQLCEALAEQVRILGHRVRVAVASGPKIAQAMARFGHAEVQLVAGDAASGALAMADLPLSALPLDSERLAWLGRLGIFQVKQLAQFAPAAISPWLGQNAVSILQLIAGVDKTPLMPLTLSDRPVPVECSVSQPLLFKNSQQNSQNSLRAWQMKSRPGLRKASLNHRSLSLHKLGLSPEREKLTRHLPYPQKIDVPLRKGAAFSLGAELYVIEQLRFVRRIAETKWWKETSVSRDYHWAWLRGTRGGTEALLFVDKKSGIGFVQALRD